MVESRSTVVRLRKPNTKISILLTKLHSLSSPTAGKQVIGQLSQVLTWTHFWHCSIVYVFDVPVRACLWSPVYRNAAYIYVLLQSPIHKHLAPIGQGLRCKYFVTNVYIYIYWQWKQEYTPRFSLLCFTKAWNGSWLDIVQPRLFDFWLSKCIVYLNTLPHPA